MRTQVKISHETLSSRSSRNKTERVAVVSGVEVGICHRAGKGKTARYRSQHQWVGDNSIYRPVGGKGSRKGAIHNTGVSFF